MHKFNVGIGRFYVTEAGETSAHSRRIKRKMPGKRGCGDADVEDQSSKN